MSNIQVRASDAWDELYDEIILLISAIEYRNLLMACGDVNEADEIEGRYMNRLHTIKEAIDVQREFLHKHGVQYEIQQV